jgi:hypothetical protein
MIRRTLSALFGAFLFSIITPIAYFLLFESFPLEGLKGLGAVSAAGATFGVVIGAIFPRVFGFIFEMFLNS